MRNPQIQQRMNPLHSEGLPYCRRYECKSPWEPFALGGAIVLSEIPVRASLTGGCLLINPGAQGKHDLEVLMA